MPLGLSVSRLISVSVSLNPQGAIEPSVTTCMIVGDSDVIDVGQRYRSYNGLAAVANDFGTSAPEYAAAALFFGQKPSPQQLYIGRWAQSATHGHLFCNPLTTAQQAITNWNTIANGSFHIAVDGNAAVSITGLNFTADTNLNGVATTINTALTTASAGASVAWTGSQFEFTSATTGTNSAVAPLTAGAGGTDISGQLGGIAADNPRVVNGIAAETALAALTILDNLPVSFYMVTYASTHIVDADHLAIAAFVEGDSENPHVYGVTTNEAAALLSTDTTSIGYQLKQLDYNRTITQWSNTSYAISSAFGFASTTNFDAQNGTATLAYKQEPGVVPESLTASQADALDANNYTYYATFNNGVSVIVNGQMASGIYFDDQQGADWLAETIQTDEFNLLFQTPTKIPQTDAGMHQIATTAENSCLKGVVNGLIGPGTWEFESFGNLNTGDYLQKGYYVFAPPIASQSSSQRAEREGTVMQIAAIFQGAVQKVGILINVQR